MSVYNLINMSSYIINTVVAATPCPREEYEIATVKEVKSSRYDHKTRKLEYLIAWVEYPDQDTWESIENLQASKHLIE